MSLNASGDTAAESLDAYLERVRRDNRAVQPTPGSIWTEAGRLTRMSSDVRASRPHDLIQVVVSENLAASTDGTVKNSRASNTNSGISGLIGTLHAGNALQNLVNQNSTAGLSAQGASATNSSLSTTLGGQVVDVLPNGMLVIEAARQVEFSQQTETIILRGLVRPEDISQQNQVLSTAISSMELQVRGKGIVTDYTHRPNALVRLLQRVLVF
ncbi:MAG TPA: flagellar basal body L-ring protein FlgH [Acidobacteriaceae bacterium]|nr:flagellar basal body L-ring protein FlgH [Acidobacteriaceae bacterium]